MLTPAFEISQDAEYLTINVKAPFARITDTEIFIEENEFRFHSKPYFLRLTLPGNIVEDGRESATYDSDKGSFVIKVPKQVPGEEFDGLDMITKLLTPKGQTSAKQPLIEVIDDGNEHNPENPDSEEEEEEEEFDWHVKQHPFQEEEVLLDAPKYGFANQRSGVFGKLQEEICEIVDLKEPDKVSFKDRRKLRIESENDKFDEDYYLADLHQDEIIQQLLQYESPWQQELQLIKNGSPKEDILKFTEEEQEKMIKLPKKKYLIEESVLPSVYLGLIDLLFAYAYNHRITEGENNVESSWNICKISSTLSWLEVFTNLEEVVVTCFRRVLCFPLYRHWDLANMVLQDTQQILSLGKQRILKCLLEMHTILSESYPRYILNDLYVTDYCVWIQSSSDKKLESLSQALTKIKLEKSDANFGLLEIEEAAKILQEDDDNDIDNVTNQIAQCQLSEDLKSSKHSKDSDDDSSSSDENTSSDDECTDSDDEYSESDDEDTQIDLDKKCIENNNVKESDKNVSNIHVSDKTNSENNGICEIEKK